MATGHEFSRDQVSDFSGGLGHGFCVVVMGKRRAGKRAFCLVRPAGRTHLEVKVLYHPASGSVSRTARVSVARRNLKSQYRVDYF